MIVNFAGRGDDVVREVAERPVGARRPRVQPVGADVDQQVAELVERAG